MKNTDRQSRHFESIAKRYFSARQTANHLLYKELLWRHVFRKIPPMGPGKYDVLEPMCGYAEGKSIIERFFCPDIRYEGFDTSKTLLEEASRSRPDLNLFEADVTSFVPQKKYDIIILTGGLHHVHHEAGTVLATLRRAIKNSGIFINFEPTHNSSCTRQARARIYKTNSFFDFATEKGFTLQELNDLYHSAGFRVTFRSIRDRWHTFCIITLTLFPCLM